MQYILFAYIYLSSYEYQQFEKLQPTVAAHDMQA